METTIHLKPQMVDPEWDADTDDPPPDDPAAEALIRVEVEGLGSFRLAVSAQPARHNMPGIPADCLIVSAWRVAPDGAGDTDPDEGIAPLFVEDEEEDDDSEEEEEEDGEEQEEGVFVSDEAEPEEGGLVIGPAPDDEEEDEFPSAVPDEAAEMGAPPDVLWVFEPQRGFLVAHPDGHGTYCPVCAEAGPAGAAEGFPCPACAARKGPLPDPYAGLRGR